MKTRSSFCLTVALYCSFLSVALSGGFQLNDHGARATAMSFSPVALHKDASALYYNPAGIGQLPAGLHFSAGSAVIMPTAKFAGLTSMNQSHQYELEKQTFFVPHIYGVWNFVDPRISVGIGIFAPFGLGTHWPENWIGRHLALESTLEAIAIQPVVGFTIPVFDGKKFSVAAGPFYMMSSVKSRRKIPTFDPEPEITLSGDGNGWGFVAGATYEIGDELKFGFAYRYSPSISYSGTATYANVQGVESLFQAGSGETEIQFPSDARFGVAYQLMEHLWIELSVNYVEWSSYDTLRIVLDKAPGDPTTGAELVNPRNYQDIFAARLGFDYQLTEKFAVRWGMAYDPKPVESRYVEPTLPEIERINFSLGIGYQISSGIWIDAAYLGITGAQTEVQDSPAGFDGIYTSWANIFIATVNVKL